MAYQTLVKEYSEAFGCKAYILPPENGSFVSKIIIVGSCCTIVYGFCQFLDTGVGQLIQVSFFGTTITQKVKEKLEKHKSNFCETLLGDEKIKSIKMFYIDDDKKQHVIEIKREDFHKHIIKDEDNKSKKDNNKIVARLEKDLSTKEVSIGLSKDSFKAENVVDGNKTGKEENKYDNIPVLVSFEKKMTFKEIKEYLSSHYTTELIGIIEKNIADKNKDDKKDFVNLFKNANN